jgi:hypothetical protein
VFLDSATLTVTSDTSVRRMIAFSQPLRDPKVRDYVSVFRYNGRYRRVGNTVLITYPDQSEASIAGEDTATVLAGRIRVGLRESIVYAAQALELTRR